MRKTATAALLLASLAGGLYGIGRSLWLDEAWVANSVLAPRLSGMFYYPDWLQTTPPLFLLLTRGAVRVFGLSNVSLRLVPLALTLAAVAAMLAATWRVLFPAFAVLATALMAFHPTVIEYSRTLKQYSGEMAATAVILLLTARYIEDPSLRRFWQLAGAFVLALPLAYSAIFLLPGAAIVVYAKGGIHRAGSLVLMAGGVLTVLDVFFIHPNLSPRLRAFWIDNAQGLTPGLIAAVLFCVAALTLVWKSRKPMLLVALLPCLLLAAANVAQWYPNSPRTRLFVLPCFFLAVTIAAQDLFGGRRAVTALVWIATLGFVSTALGNQVARHRNQPEEDFEGAVRYMREHVAPQDMVLVHASAKEGFNLYRTMQGWNLRPAMYGETGQPCCGRTPDSSRTVVEDLEAMVPKTFHGRVWVLYSNRPGQWNYTGLDEGQFWRTYLHEKGCTAGPSLDLPAMDISALDCNWSHAPRRWCYSRRTTKRLIEYPRAPPTNTSETKWAESETRENATAPARPYAT